MTLQLKRISFDLNQTQSQKENNIIPISIVYENAILSKTIMLEFSIDSLAYDIIEKIKSDYPTIELQGLLDNYND